VGLEQKKAELFRKFVAMTDRMQHIRLDLQKRVDEAMEETKGYKAEGS
jgi:vacuolar-type H+-ATPase subunit D/Vma8